MIIMQHLYRLSVTAKLVIISVIALLFCVGPAYQIVQDSRSKIESFETRKQGIPYVRQLFKITYLAHKYRGLYLSAGEYDETAISNNIDRAALEREIDVLFRSLSDLPPALAERAQALRMQYQALLVLGKNQQVDHNNIETYFMFVDFFSAMYDFRVDVARHYTLHLESSRDAYFVTQLMGRVVPDLMGNLARLRNLGYGMLMGTLRDDSMSGQINEILRTTKRNLQVLEHNFAILVGEAETALGAADILKEQTGIVRAVQSTINTGKVQLLDEQQSMDPDQFMAEMNKVMDDLYKLDGRLSAIADELFSKAKEKETEKMWLHVIQILLFFVLLCGLIFILSRSIIVPLQIAQQSAVNIANNNFEELPIHVDGDTEIPSLLNSLDTMRKQLLEHRRRNEQAVRDLTGIKAAVDNATASVMIVDNDRHILYANPASQALFARLESEIKRHIPIFNAANLLGGSIDMFYANSEQNGELFANLKQPQQTTLELGDLVFQVSISPIVHEDGTHFGTVMQWADRTIEVSAERSIAYIIEAAAAGDFSKRIDLEGKEGFFRQISESINILVETASDGLEEVAHLFAALSRGDLTQRIEDFRYQGVFKRLMHDANTMSDKLGMLIRQIQKTSDTISTAAYEINQGNQNLSIRTEQQAANIEETASSMEELSGTVEQNAMHARSASSLAQSVSDVATQSGQAMGDVVKTMRSIHSSAGRIVEIIGVIDGLAFQTNLLALNAAVEAARAGEQGRGFAVVASEVRGLAQRSTTAAREIKTLIGEVVTQIEDGTHLVDSAGHTMHDMLNSVHQVAELMQEICTASMEQASGLSQITQAMIQMDNNTQQNAALVEESAAAAESMAEQVVILSTAVSQFHLDSNDEDRRVLPQISELANAKRQQQGIHEDAHYHGKMHGVSGRGLSPVFVPTTQNMRRAQEPQQIPVRELMHRPPVKDQEKFSSSAQQALREAATHLNQTQKSSEQDLAHMEPYLPYMQGATLQHAQAMIAQQQANLQQHAHIVQSNVSAGGQGLQANTNLGISGGQNLADKSEIETSDEHNESRKEPKKDFDDNKSKLKRSTDTRGKDLGAQKEPDQDAGIPKGSDHNWEEF